MWGVLYYFPHFTDRKLRHREVNNLAKITQQERAQSQVLTPGTFGCLWINKISDAELLYLQSRIVTLHGIVGRIQ